MYGVHDSAIHAFVSIIKQAHPKFARILPLEEGQNLVGGVVNQPSFEITSTDFNCSAVHSLHDAAISTVGQSVNTFQFSSYYLLSIDKA